MDVESSLYCTTSPLSGAHPDITPLKQTDSPSPGRYQIPIAPQLVVGFHAYMTPLSGDLSSLSLHRSCACGHNDGEFICAAPLICPENDDNNKKPVSLVFFPTSDSYNLYSHFFCRDLWAVRGWVYYTMYVPSRADQSTVSDSLHIDSLSIFVLTAVNCKRKLLWWGLRDSLICGYSNKSSGVTFILYPVTRIRVLSSPLGPRTNEARGSWPL